MDEAIRHAKLNHEDADLLVVMGDLSGDFSLDSYRILSEALSQWPIPVRFLMGNHDDRQAFGQVFPETPTEGGFVQSFTDTDDAGRLVFLDTLDAGRVGGTLCAGRLSWIAETVATSGDRPLTFFMHHPPLEPGGVHFSGLCLDGSRERLLDLLKPVASRIRLLSFGHVHLDTSGTLPGGIPFCSSRGTSHHMQLALQSPAPFWIDLQPSYKVILLQDDATIVHTVTAGEFAPIGQTPANNGYRR